MKLLITPCLVASVMVGHLASGEIVRPLPAIQDIALPLTIVRETGTTEASCVLLHRRDEPGRVTLYFATAAHVFKKDDGEHLPRPKAVFVHDGSYSLEVIPADIVLPAGTVSDIALFNIVLPHSTLEPRPVTFIDPPAGSLFLIPGRGSHGQPLLVPQRVSRSSPVTVVGDRDTSELLQCVGAPAVWESGTFGIVSRCEPGAPPVISVFSFTDRWVSRHVPGLVATPPVVRTSFETSAREFTAPLMVDSCTMLERREVDVPLAHLRRLHGRTDVGAVSRS